MNFVKTMFFVSDLPWLGLFVSSSGTRPKHRVLSSRVRLSHNRAHVRALLSPHLIPDTESDLTAHSTPQLIGLKQHSPAEEIDRRRLVKQRAPQKVLTLDLVDPTLGSHVQTDLTVIASIGQRVVAIITSTVTSPSPSGQDGSRTRQTKRRS